MINGLLRGCRVLVVEDEFYQGREVRSFLEREGAEVLGPTVDEAQVFEWLQGERIDLALVDLNLGRGAKFNVAHTLQRHAIPFLILTGYDRTIIPKSLAGVPSLEKPADSRRVVRALHALRASVE